MQHSNDSRDDYHRVPTIAATPSPEDETFSYNADTAIKLNQGNENGPGDDDDLPLWQAMRKYPKIVRYCLGMTTAIIGWGYGMVLVGAIAGNDTFKADFGTEFEGELIVPGLWLSLWNALSAAGAALGSVAGGWFQDKTGRKTSLLVGAIISAVAAAFIVFAYLPPRPFVRDIIMAVGLTIQGFSVGVIKTTALTYVSENAPKALRGPAMAMFPIFTLFGQLIGLGVLFALNDVPTRGGYLGAFASLWVLALCPLILSIIMPDSPSHLLRKRQPEKALRSAKKLYGPKADPVRELNRIRAAVKSEEVDKESMSYVACFKGPDLRRTMIVILANFIQAIFGLDLLSNANVFLEVMGLDSSLALLFMIAGIIVGILANILGLWILSRVGRRSITLVSLSIVSPLWLAMGISGFWISPAGPWISGGIMIGVLAVAGSGCWPASYAIMGETSSLKLRAATQGVGGVAGQASSIIMTAILPFVYGADQGDLGAKTGFVYVGLCIVGVAATWFWLPEMKSRSMAELDHMFAIGLPTRKFKTYDMGGVEAEAMIAKNSNIP